MTTVVEGMQIDATEELGEDGLTHLQRRVLYKLVCRGEVKISTGDNQEYEIAVKLGLQPGIGGEIKRAMDELVEMGRVKRFIDTKRENAYGGPHEVRVLGIYHYRPIDVIGLCNEVLAWVFLYGPLGYEEFSSPNGTANYSTELALAMGEPRGREDELIEFMGTAVAKGLLQVTSVAEPGVKSGSYGKSYPVTKTTVTLALVA